MKHNKYSDLKIFGFPEKIQAFREGRVTAPLYVRIKPINRCMHACHWCVYSDGHTRPKDRPEAHLQSGMHESMHEADTMPIGKLTEILEDLQRMGTKAVTFSGGGEPLMHPAAEVFLDETLWRGIDLSIITNGQMLCGGRAELLLKAKWVRVSMDYANAEQMVASRNVAARSFDQVIENLEQFVLDRKLLPPNHSRPDLGINFIVTRENHLALVDAAQLLKRIGVDNVRFSPVYLQGFQEYHAPIARAVELQLQAIQSFCDEGFSVNSTYDLASASKVPSRPFTRCLYAQTVPVIGADLNVYACHNTAYSEHGRIGSIAGRRFADFWFSEEAAAKFRELNPSAVCNHECANHSKVDLFNRLADASADNFV